MKSMKYQVIIIGGGPAGYTAAESAGKAGLSVLLIERNTVGGVCLNEGCVPTKTLLYSAKTYDTVRHAARYAVDVSPELSFNLPKAVARKGKVVRKLTLGIKARLAAANVTLVTGEAYIESQTAVRCGETSYECDYLILCTGSETLIPPIPGVDKVSYWTHREALDCKERPASLAVIGGGVIGMEFASFFNSIGTDVTVVEMADEILGGMDREIAAALRAEYTKRGVRFLLGTGVTDLAPSGPEGEKVRYAYKEGEGEADRLLLSVGRRPAETGYGLENLPLERTEKGTVKVDGQMRTSLPNVYACGDLTGRSMLAHTAVREAEVAVHSILGRTDSMSYRAVPSVVYTNPEVAGVGETEESASAKGLRFRTVKAPMTYSGRFVAENEGINGLCKILLDERERIIGAHVLGNPASEIITLAATAIELGLTAEEWKRIIFPHPTAGEIFRELLG